MTEQPTTPAPKTTSDDLDLYLADLGIARPALQAPRIPVIGLYLLTQTRS